MKKWNQMSKMPSIQVELVLTLIHTVSMDYFFSHPLPLPLSLTFSCPLWTVHDLDFKHSNVPSIEESVFLWCILHTSVKCILKDEGIQTGKHICAAKQRIMGCDQ